MTCQGGADEVRFRIETVYFCPKRSADDIFVFSLLKEGSFPDTMHSSLIRRSRLPLFFAWDDEASRVGHLEEYG